MDSDLYLKIVLGNNKYHMLKNQARVALDWVRYFFVSLGEINKAFIVF